MLDKEEVVDQLNEKVFEIREIASEFVGNNMIDKKGVKNWFLPFIEKLEVLERLIDDFDDLEVLKGEDSE